MLNDLDIAREQLAFAEPTTIGNPTAALQSALARSIIALCDCLNDLSCLVAIPKVEDET